ncbi:MAG: Ig-like domain-containing protein [Defluviitaleaceae bacterium]|nr:Ig-like domain-containing protein [Defluviitaleaceae bacterium]
MPYKKIALICGSAVLLISSIAAVYILFIRQPAQQEYNGYHTAQATPTPPTPQPTPQYETIINGEFAIAPSAIGQLSITPVTTTDFGVATDSAFLITSDNLTEAHLRAYLSASKAFTISAQTGNTFLLEFDEELTSNQIYNIVYAPPGMQSTSHAFQTMDIFRITSTTPATHTHGIPVNTGIEVTFSQALEGNFEDAFTIDPPVQGSFIQRGNTHIFVPDGLAYQTAYTVTISQTLESTMGYTLAEEFSFTFTTQWGMANIPTVSLSGSEYETFLPWNEVFIAINISRDFPERDFTVRLYDLQTPQQFLNFTGTSSGQLVDTFELEAREFEAEFQSFFYLFLDQTLPVGYYVAEVRPAGNPDIVLHKFIQVSPVSVYSLSIDGELVFWIHDAATGQPAVGAQIRINGAAAATTNNSGIAIVETSAQSRANITIDYADYFTFAYVKQTFAQRPLLISDRFLSYIYTDRPSYRPNDTMDIFGVVRPRYGQSHRPDDVLTLRIGDMLVLPVTLDRMNSFAMRVPVTNMFGHVDIILEVNGERLMSTWVRFHDYTNLSFVLEGGLDRVAYMAGDTAQAEVSVSTFTGVPMEGITLTHGWGDNRTSMVTNNYGIATAGLPVSTRWGWRPQWESFWLSVASDAQISQAITLPYIVVPADIMLEHEMDGSTATITTNRILIERLNDHFTAEDRWGHLDPDIFRGPAVDADFTITITRYVTTRTIARQTYDHINRRTVTTYDFSTVDYVYRTIHGRTEDGIATITGLPTSDDPMIRYRIEVSYQDTGGRTITVSMFDSGWRHFQQESSIRHFGLLIEERRMRVNQTGYIVLGEGYNMWWGNDQRVPITQGRLLTVLVRDGVIAANVGSPAGTPVTFTEACITSAFVFGAYFDGRYIFPIAHPLTLYYDYTQRELDIGLTFDAEIYSPGDEVTVTIQSAPQAQVVISVVDETSIITDWHRPSFLSRLYHSSWAHWPNVRHFASHTQHNFGGAGGGAEGGGGDNGGADGALRGRFIDNPVFEVVQTDANGRATLTFTLPEQVTSWRVTAIGLTAGGLAGDVRYNILAHLDFYVDLMLTTEYIVGDDIAAVARVVGYTGPVNFAYSVLQGGAVVHSGTQTASRTMMLNAGKLPAGEYTMQVTATAGGHSDGMELPFTVAEGGLILPTRTSGQLIPTSFDYLAMRPLPVRVTLTNANIGPLSSILHGVWDGGSFRTDVMAANSFINYFFGHTDELQPVPVQVSSGGIPQLTYETADFYYTARFAASFPEFVNGPALIRYINSEMYDANPTMRAAGLLALAAIGEPVLLRIQEEISGLEARDTMTMLYLAAALVAIGDDAGAAALIQEQGTSWADSFRSDGETLETLLFFINTAINPQSAWMHVNRNWANEFVSDVPERVNFVRRAYVLGATVSEVEYYLHGTTHTARLHNFESLSLHLSQEQFETLNLRPVMGETDFHVHFYGYDGGNWAAADNRVNIRRTMVRDGDLFRVDFHVTVPEPGFYTVYDRVPSNMRIITLPRRWDDVDRFFVRHVQRQLVEVSFAVGQGEPFTRTVSYFAMELFEADMAVGAAYVSNRQAQGHVWGRTE